MNHVLARLWLLFLVIHSTVCKVEKFVNRKKVCVIGAGPCGLAAVKQIASLPDVFEPIAFERNSDVGGLWIYTDRTEFDKYGLPVHSSMYKNLRTNAPKELMAYADYRDVFGEEHSCVSHETVLEYLKNYANHFNLRQFIQFNTFVEKVSPLSRKSNTKWLIETRNLISNKRQNNICDAVMICNGNLFKPNVPKIPGIDEFQGQVLHSHIYRKPDEFVNQTVAILGASYSGQDIAFELSNVAKKVYLSHRHDKIESEMPSNIEQVPGIVKVVDNQLILSDGTDIFADSLIFCTGFDYSFPFLDTNSGIIVDKGKFVHPLYKDLININYTTMSFVGLARDNVGFATYDLQARYFLSVLQGNTKLPSYNEMLEDSKIPEGVSIGHVHDFGDRQWSYYADLAKAAEIENLPPFYEKGFKIWEQFVKENLMTFKNSDLRVLDDGNVEIVEWDYV